jgi:HSP20 family molecular chaperone IbpA
MATTIPNLLNWMQEGVDQMGGGDFREFIHPARWPLIEITETPDHLYIYLDIPGVEIENVQVEFFNNIALVTGTRNRPDNNTLAHSTVRELTFGDFSRRITMPLSVTRRDSVTISSRRGVMTIDINKLSEEQNRFTVGLENNSDS